MKNLTEIKMANEHHSNPFISILSGTIGGLYAFIQTNGFIIQDLLEFLKIIVFGFIGGMVGYLGKIVAEKWHKYLKDKSKDICK